MRNPFAGILSLFARGEERVVGVDFGSSAVKVVQIKKKAGQAVLETYGAVALGPYAGSDAGRAAHLPPARLAEALRDVLREAKVTAQKCGVAVPMSASMIAAIELPIRADTDMSRLIPIEARKYIPTPISEVQLDWRVVEGAAPPAGTDAAAPKEKTDVLITAVHRDALERLTSTVADAGLTPSFFEIEVFATVRASFPEPDAVVGMVDIGAALTKIGIVDRGVLRDAHIVNRGGQDLTLALAQSQGISVAEAEARKRLSVGRQGAQTNGGEGSTSAITSFILAEAHEAFAHYEARARRALSTIVLSGGGALTPGLVAAAGKAFALPVTTMDPFARLAAPAFLSPLLAQAGPEFAVATGIALRRLEETR